MDILNTRVPENGPKSSKACVRALVEVSTCTPENGRPNSQHAQGHIGRLNKVSLSKTKAPK